MNTNIESSDKEFLTRQLQETQKEIRNLKALGLAIVIIALLVGGYTLIHAFQNRNVSAASAAPIFAGLFLVRLVTAPLNKKKELAWELDNKLNMMESSGDIVI